MLLIIFTFRSACERLFLCWFMRSSGVLEIDRLHRRRIPPSPESSRRYIMSISLRDAVGRVLAGYHARNGARDVLAVWILRPVKITPICASRNRRPASTDVITVTIWSVDFDKKGMSLLFRGCVTCWYRGSMRLNFPVHQVLLTSFWKYIYKCFGVVLCSGGEPRRRSAGG